jgi:acyl-CoA synthetase (AMP-forming)/AMP-acid ligase II
VEGYGLSEGTCASTVNPWDGLRKPGTVGLPMPGQEVRIVDADGAGVGAGVTGEVQISGENVMAGYLGKPEETRAVLADGWLKTGDLGHLDVDGYLVIDGRVKDMIIRGGENIYPREIEDVLASHPDVIDVAVVGRPDETWGEIVTAFITTGRDSDASRTFDAPYKRPAVMSVLPALPLNPVGKIDKLELRSIAIETQLSRGLG